MENNFKTRKLPTTILGKAVQSGVILVGITTLAWSVLVGWFGIEALDNKDLSFNKVKIINEKNIRLLTSNVTLVKKITEWPTILNHIISESVTFLVKGENVFINQYGGKNLTISSNKFETLIGMLSATSQIILSRIFIITLYVPLFLIMMFIMIVDGLGQRDIRKFSGARESSYLFHQFKRLPEILIYSVLFVYLSLPLPLNPEFLLMAIGLVCGVLVMYTVKGYKKYV